MMCCVLWCVVCCDMYCAQKYVEKRVSALVAASGGDVQPLFAVPRWSGGSQQCPAGAKLAVFAFTLMVVVGCAALVLVQGLRFDGLQSQSQSGADVWRGASDAWRWLWVCAVAIVLVCTL